ncbi:MAG TPA: protoporphyrinogen oxidase, partial [Herpetosiphonaceae bacterium]|nr:protoporphyrinogen oxidase [Herpetosiphonaceae bacterium]
RGGVGRFVEALVPALTDGRVEVGVAVAAIDRDAHGYRLRTSTGSSYLADAVVLATPAYVSARIVQDLAPSLADSLGRIRYVSSGTVSLAFRRDEVRHPLNGFGFVVPRGERRRIFGCTWNSSKLAGRAPEGHVLLRAFVGGAGRENIVDLPDDELVALVRAELEQIMGLDAEPLLTRVYRWHHANPQYQVGHLERVRGIHAQAESIGALYLTGSAFEGVGLPDCVRQAQATATRVLAALPRAREAVEITAAS